MSSKVPGKKAVRHLLKKRGNEPKIKRDVYETGEDAIKAMRAEDRMTPVEKKKQDNTRWRMGPEAKLVYLFMKGHGFKRLPVAQIGAAMNLTKSDVNAARGELRNAGLLVSGYRDYDELELLGDCDFGREFGALEEK